MLARAVFLFHYAVRSQAASFHGLTFAKGRTSHNLLGESDPTHPNVHLLLLILMIFITITIIINVNITFLLTPTILNGSVTDPTGQYMILDWKVCFLRAEDIFPVKFARIEKTPSQGLRMCNSTFL